MKHLTILGALGGLLLLVACTEPADETYPVTGASCGPNDPVHDLQNLDCAPPSGI